MKPRDFCLGIALVGFALAVTTAVALSCSNSSSSSAVTAADLNAACRHICQCLYTDTDLTTCEGGCSSGSSSSSSSSSLSSYSASFSYGSYSYSLSGSNTTDKACVDCYKTVPCSELQNGTACSTACN